jgi:hypothetical protein
MGNKERRKENKGKKRGLQKEAITPEKKSDSDSLVPELAVVRKKRKAKKERQKAKKAAAKVEQALKEKAAIQSESDVETSTENVSPEEKSTTKKPKEKSAVTSPITKSSANKSGEKEEFKMELVGAGEITSTMKQADKKLVWDKFWYQIKHQSATTVTQPPIKAAKKVDKKKEESRAKKHKARKKKQNKKKSGRGR